MKIPVILCLLLVVSISACASQTPPQKDTHIQDTENIDDAKTNNQAKMKLSEAKPVLIESDSELFSLKIYEPPKNIQNEKLRELIGKIQESKEKLGVEEEYKLDYNIIGKIQNNGKDGNVSIKTKVWYKSTNTIAQEKQAYAYLKSGEVYEFNTTVYLITPYIEGHAEKIWKLVEENSYYIIETEPAMEIA